MTQQYDDEVPPTQDSPQSPPPVADPESELDRFRRDGLPPPMCTVGGRYLHRPTVDTHRCPLPVRDGGLLWVLAEPAGTVWECSDCGQVWHVVHVPDVHYGNRTTVAHREWRRETRRQRRKRLGLRWWQREAR